MHGPRLRLVTKPDKRRDARASVTSPSFSLPSSPFSFTLFLPLSLLFFSEPPSTYFFSSLLLSSRPPRVFWFCRDSLGSSTCASSRRKSGCTEAIYFWHPFLLRLVHPFIICIRFCCRVPVGSVFVGPLRAHVSIFLAAGIDPPTLRCTRTKTENQSERKTLSMGEISRGWRR